MVCSRSMWDDSVASIEIVAWSLGPTTPGQTSGVPLNNYDSRVVTLTNGKESH